MNKITIDFSKHSHGVKSRVFDNESEARRWIMSGICACEGAERNHYVDMLCQLEEGKTTLYY